MASSTLLATLLIVVATTQAAFAAYYSTCDPPRHPDYGGYSPYKTKYYVGSKIKFYCNSGYVRHGSVWSVCREYNKRVYWSHPPPVCKPIARCDKLDDPLYGNVKVKGYSHGSTAQYSCNSGYKLVGNAYRRCHYGVWTGKEPVCHKIIKCIRPDHPQYGYVQVTGYYPGANAYFKCRRGYEIYGDARLTCLNTGYWGGKIPVCKKIIRCPDLDDPPYGSVNQTGNKPGDTAHYECDDGFKLVGDEYRECLKTGYFSGKEPVCKKIIRCPYLDDPPYGSVSQTGNKPGDTAHYSCDKHFRLVGDRYLKCLKTGYWNGSEPVCKPILCPDLYDPPNGTVKMTGNKPGSTAHYFCDYGFRLVGDIYQKCLYNGYWSGKEPVCKPILCPDLDDPPYGSVSQTDNKPGSTAHYSCDKHFRLVGDRYRECLYTGYWNGSEPVCKPIICPDLDDPPYGTVKTTGNKPGSTAHYFCDYGFKLVGDRYRKCLYNGYWSGSEPICKKIIRCPDLDDPPYGSVNQTGNKPGDTAHYECDDGFKLVGDEYRDCLKTGYFSGKEPVCKKIIRCPDLDDPPYGSVSQTGNKPGSTAHYECNKGFKLVGDRYRECLKTGYWNSSEPVCKRAVCPPLVAPRYGRVDQRGNTPSSKAYYSCNYGYQLHGLKWRKCLYDGTWYGDSPVCRPLKTCRHPGALRYGKVRIYRNNAYYRCNTGYKLYGLQWRKCLDDGSWHGSAPTCYPVKY